MKNEITQILEKFNFIEGLCIYRKAGGSEFWAQELENETNKEYADRKLKELLQRILDSFAEVAPEEQKVFFVKPKKIEDYRKRVQDCYDLLRTSHARIKVSESVKERKVLAFTILSTVKQINEYMNIIRFWERTGRLVENEAEIIDLTPKKKGFKEKPLPTTQIDLYKEKKNLESYLSPQRIKERNTKLEKVAYWKQRLERVKQKLDAF
ncbi:hypothetical protein V9L05_15240 [Bernardetia sp. Wsw4-3y2]|uniref:hypothetical protein n=1 Tax=Bernardetia sp. Wsw4-3y2 TaxID=3127471 RepID=UPI0030D125FE